MKIIICGPLQNYDHSNGILALIHMGLGLMSCGWEVKFCITGVDDQSQFVIDLLNLREYENQVNTFEYELLLKLDKLKEDFEINFLYDYSKDNIERNIVLYPETIIDNPLRATQVVRYFGNKDGVLIDGKVKIGIRDFILSHSKSIHAEADHYLFFSHIHPAFKVNQLIPFEHRTFSSYYTGKGYLYSQPQSFPEMIEITRHWPAHKSQLSIILQNSQLFFTYDSWSNINVEAIMCGAIPVFLHNGPFTDEEIDGGELGALPRIKFGEAVDFSVEKISDFYKKRSELLQRIEKIDSDWKKGVFELSKKLIVHFN